MSDSEEERRVPSGRVGGCGFGIRFFVSASSINIYLYTFLNDCMYSSTDTLHNKKCVVS